MDEPVVNHFLTSYWDLSLNSGRPTVANGQNNGQKLVLNLAKFVTELGILKHS